MELIDSILRIGKLDQKAQACMMGIELSKVFINDWVIITTRIFSLTHINTLQWFFFFVGRICIIHIEASVHSLAGKMHFAYKDVEGHYFIVYGAAMLVFLISYFILQIQSTKLTRDCGTTFVQAWWEL